MAVCQSALQGLDPLTFSAILEMQLEDTMELTSTSKGKKREGVKTDAELALEMYSEDLRQCQETLADRKMAQSVALAVLRDGHLIRQVDQVEDQVARDRQIALRMNWDDSELNECVMGDTGKSRASAEDPWANDELLAKAAALYNETAHDFPSPPSSCAGVAYDEDSDTGPAAESSAWAALRRTRNKPKQGTCVACGDTKDFFDVARVPCDHEYCRECLANLFRASMTDESLFPPSCDKQQIKLDQVRFFLPSDLIAEFEVKSVELGEKNRLYCHDARCSAFIPRPKDSETDWLACPRCEKTTCTTCKGVAHSGDCPDDIALQQLLDTADAEQWQRCYQCSRMVELETGCNHMWCACRAEFCYVCGLQWKTCQCPQWDEPRLLARATQIVQRDPRRRLFQPTRTMQPQPKTPRRQSVHEQTWNFGNIPGPAPAAHPSAPLPPMSPVSAWESDFSDHSDWEQDWGYDHGSPKEDDSDVNTLTGPTETRYKPATLTESANRQSEPSQQRHQAQHDEAAPSMTTNQVLLQKCRGDVAAKTSPAATAAQQLCIADMVAHLRANHDCSHNKWKFVGGAHTCEHCHFRLPSYIFECRQCHLQACNRCRRNRL